MNTDIITLGYLIAAVLFILALKGLTHPRTAVRGNFFGAVGMLLAIVLTLFNQDILSWTYIAIGLGVGTVVGGLFALKIQMTAMPQLVAVFNGFGGAASFLVAGATLIYTLSDTDRAATEYTPLFKVATLLSGMIGAVTLTGSVVAFLKLQELMWRNIRFGGQAFVNLALTLGCLSLGYWMWSVESAEMAYWILIGVASLLGVLLVVPIGGADMPVVIALLNSYSGIAAAATGFVIQNNALIISGSLVGASGIILTNIMCKAMNRSLTNVLFGTMEPSAEGPSADEVYAGKVKAASADEVAILFDTAQTCIIVPGYGMAVAQCQHNVRDLTNLLESRGVQVDFAVHPVAGRMPGHMNVLLAEADIPYEKLLEMDVVNPQFEQTDVVIVLGANDVVNPVARTDPSSPIAGMPILDVDKARTVVVIKRSLSPGFAGIPNPLFAADNALMLFGDAKKAILELISAVKES